MHTCGAFSDHSLRFEITLIEQLVCYHFKCSLNLKCLRSHVSIFQDNQEICFVEDEGYRKLSEFDPEAETLLNKAMAGDA